jgi:hypothetical protein
MSQGGYSHTTRATGTVLTAAIYNNDHQNHITNQNPTMTGALSDSLTQMQTIADPGDIGSERLAANLAEELEYLRFMIRSITGRTQWYQPPPQNLSQIGAMGDDSVPLAKLQFTTPGRLITRKTTGTGPWESQQILDLDALVPAVGDFILSQPAAGGALRKTDVAQVFPLFAPSEPQGRLSLISGNPLTLVNTQSPTMFWVPFKGQWCPLYNGTQFVMRNCGGQLSQLTTDNTKSPAATVLNACYDLFIWEDTSVTPSVIRLSRGPKWTDDVTRGTPAEITSLQGFYVNNVAITNGPAQYRGTYVGSVRTDASALYTVSVGGVGTGGASAFLGLWNKYHRHRMALRVLDSTTSWLIPVAGWRALNNSGQNRIYYMTGLIEQAATFGMVGRAQINPGHQILFSVGIDTSVANSSVPQTYWNHDPNNPADISLTSQVETYPQVGMHYVQALENSASANGVTVVANGYSELWAEIWQ